MSISQQERGKRGRRAEKAVARRLWWEGYRILERNYATRSGEVDIIARKGDTVAFVEVRSRQEGSEVPPRDTVTYAKQKRIHSAASAFLKAKRLNEVSVRYDIAEVWLNDRGRPQQIEIIEGAFGDPHRG
jgi:putative endonuclease